MYLTFEEYQEYGGTLDKATFNDLEYQASAEVDWYTFNRLKNDTVISDDVKRCVYQLIKLLQLANTNLGISDGDNQLGNLSRVASQSNDGVAITYNLIAANELSTKVKDEVEQTIRKYLNSAVNELGRKLLYRGLYPNE